VTELFHLLNSEKAVLPHLSFKSTLAPLSIKSWTISLHLYEWAIIKPVLFPLILNTKRRKRGKE
jgi:hypothetical protein